MSATKKTTEVIKQFLTQMANQDRKGTADIFYYTIQTEVMRPAPLDACKIIRYQFSDVETLFESKEAIETYIKDNREYWSLQNVKDPNELEERIDDLIGNTRICKKLGFNKYWQSKGIFFTETDAIKHLAANKHHYSDNAKVYVEHAWRAPELKAFFQALFEHFDVPKQWG